MCGRVLLLCLLVLSLVTIVWSLVLFKAQCTFWKPLHGLCNVWFSCHMPLKWFLHSPNHSTRKGGPCWRAWEIRPEHGACRAREGVLQNLIYKNMYTKKCSGHARENTGTKSIEIYLKYCCWSAQTLQTGCPGVGALTILFKGGVLLMLQDQVMFVLLEADDCDLAGRKRIPNLAGFFFFFSNGTDLRQNNLFPSYTEE